MSAERRDLLTGFERIIRDRFPGAAFGYGSFPDLEYDEWVFSELFRALKEGGIIVSSGYMMFRLKEPAQPA